MTSYLENSLIAYCRFFDVDLLDAEKTHKCFQWPLIRCSTPAFSIHLIRANAFTLGEMLKIKITDINFIGSLFLAKAF